MPIDNYKGKLLERSLSMALLLYVLVAAVSISATNIVLVVIYLIGLIFVWKKKGKEHFSFDKQLLILFIAIFSWGAFCTILSGNYVIPDVFDDMWEYSPLVFFPLLLSLAVVKKERIIDILLLSSSLVSILGIIQCFAPTIVYPFPRQLIDPYSRLRGFFSHPLHAGGFYSIVAILSFSMILFMNIEGRKKVYVWGACIINLLSVVLTMSRSYLISVVLAIIILSLVKSWKLMISTTLLLAAIIILLLSFHSDVSTRVKTLTDPDYSSNKERTYIWESGMAMTIDHPLFGVGKGNWKKEAKEKYFPRIEKKYNYKLADYGHAHNSYLTWASETGIIGLMLYLSFWLTVIWRLYSRVSHEKIGSLDFVLITGSLAGIGNLLVAGLFENNFGTSVVLLLIAFLVGLSLHNNPSDIEPKPS